MEKESGTVHFSMGSDFGLLLMNLANEHLIYSHNYEKAIGTILDSLQGCPYDLALKILKGDIVLITDVKEQVLDAATREEEHESIFPKIDMAQYYKQASNDLLKNGKQIIDMINRVVGELHLTSNSGFEIEIEYAPLIKYLYKGNESEFYDLIDELISENENVVMLKGAIDVTRKYIEEAYRIEKTLDWVRHNYKSDFDNSNFERPLDYVPEYSNILEMVINKFKSLLNYNPALITEQFKQVQQYLDMEAAIKSKFKKHIVPDKIEDLYDAGWLSPNGDFYGLNGEIANMLHAQIADKLVEDEIVQIISDDKDMIADRYLRENGWVTIHKGWILYDGYYFSKEITPEQQQALYVYGQHYTLKTGKLLLAGINKTPITGVRIQSLDKIQLKKIFDV